MGYRKRKTLMKQITKIIFVLSSAYKSANVSSWTTCRGVVDNLETKRNSCAFVKIPRSCFVC